MDSRSLTDLALYESLGGALEKVGREELIQLLSLTEGWSRGDDSKFKVYQPNPIMPHFHSSEAKCRCLFGGNRSGKTYASSVDVVSQFLGRAPKALEGVIPSYRLNPERRIRYNMGDYPNSFQKVIWPTLSPLIPHQDIQDVVKEAGRIKAITNSKGGFIEFMQYDQLVSKFQGSSRHVMLYDEEPPEAIRDENLMRLVDTDGEEIFALTPVSGALKWLYDGVYLKSSLVMELEDGKLVSRSLPEGDPDIHTFFASIYDNVAISRKAASRILSKFPKEEMTVREKGHFLFLSGLVYKEWNDLVHLIDESAVPWYSPGAMMDYTLYIAIDPHPRTPHAVLFMVARRDGLLFVVDELFMEGKATDLVDSIKVKCRGVKPEMILIDPLANTPDPATGISFTTSLIDAGLDDPMPINAPKDKTSGILKVKDLLRVNKEGFPGIYVASNCVKFRSEITHWAWDDWRRDTSLVKGEKQKPVDKDDHMMENLYRLALRNIGWVDRSLYDDEWDDDEWDRWDEDVSEDLVGAGGRSLVTGY